MLTLAAGLLQYNTNTNYFLIHILVLNFAEGGVNDAETYSSNIRIYFYVFNVHSFVDI
jgi:hypothetical protein